MLEKPSAQNPETEREPSLEEKKEILLTENPVIANDPIFQEIISSLNDGWETLSEAKKKSVLKGVENLIESLKEYHDSYVGLKASARKERSLYLGDTAKYQAAVKNADERERILHNAFIDSVNILSRTMKNSGLSNEWRGNDEIYALDKWGTRQKLKHWMFKIFGEQV